MREFFIAVTISIAMTGSSQMWGSFLSRVVTELASSIDGFFNGRFTVILEAHGSEGGHIKEKIAFGYCKDVLRRWFIFMRFNPGWGYER